jgi:hypothetical protein
VRKFVHQDLKEWLARLLSRPDIERDVEKSLSENRVHSDGTWKDIWDGQVLRNLRGPDGHLFARPHGDDLHLVFSLGVDGFNPGGKRTGKNTGSVQGIYMICLNIPIERRYDPENMFLVGLIPGPNKPSLEEINHGIKPLVDDLLDCWDPGLFISCTAMRRHGRRVLAALIPLVCDILGARQTGGFSGVTSTLFCSFCYLTLDQIENFDMNSWKLRDGKTHRRHAQAWRDAKTPEERDAITREFGVRDSELLRLPYWDPITCTVLDSMHAFFLNSIPGHIRDIWGVSMTSISGDDGSIGPKPHPPLPYRHHVAAALRILHKGHGTDADIAKLSRTSKPVLWHLCFQFRLRRAGTAVMLSRTLLQWVSSDFRGDGFFEYLIMVCIVE